jgi:hypothetical protein
VCKTNVIKPNSKAIIIYFPNNQLLGKTSVIKKPIKYEYVAVCVNKQCHDELLPLACLSVCNIKSPIQWMISM